MNSYEVKNLMGRCYYCRAASGSAAKRDYCRFRGIRPSDPWCGMSMLKARKLSPEEAEKIFGGSDEE